MTKWQAFDLRPQNQPWPGLNTRGGKLDPGQGQLEDGSINAVINEADILEKRKGFIRGLDERFGGPVCGLFRYTDDCGVEYLVVADGDGVHVRTPFDIPVFLGSESLPNDEFNGDLNTARWTNTTDYETFQSSLVLTGISIPSDQSVVPNGRLMQWFKAAAVTSYQVEIDYAFVATGAGQAVAVAIKRLGDTYLLANIYLSPSEYTVTLQIVQAGVATALDSIALGGAGLANGFLRLGYNSETRTATARVIPSGGDQVTLAATLSEALDANLGQNSAIGMVRAVEDQVEIVQVRGGLLGS